MMVATCQKVISFVILHINSLRITIKSVAQYRCFDRHVKEPYEMSMVWESHIRSKFISPPAHYITFITETSLIVTLSNLYTYT